MDAVVDILTDEAGDILASALFLRERWRPIWSNPRPERLKPEIRCRTDGVDIFPNHPAVVRLAGVVLVEKPDGWAVGERYAGLEALARARLRVMTAPVRRCGWQS